MKNFKTLQKEFESVHNYKNAFTYRIWKSLGFQVKKGEKATWWWISFYKTIDKKTKKEKSKMANYKLFTIKQVEPTKEIWNFNSLTDLESYLFEKFTLLKSL